LRRVSSLHSGGGTTYLCDICHATFPERDSAFAHVHNHVGPERCSEPGCTNPSAVEVYSTRGREGVSLERVAQLRCQECTEWARRSPSERSLSEAEMVEDLLELRESLDDR
jgi:hypothetical protein